MSETAEQAVKRVIAASFPRPIHRIQGGWLQTGPDSINLDDLAHRITKELRQVGNEGGSV